MKIGERGLKILYVGQTWNGSSARSMREALAALPGVEMDDIGEDHFFPSHRRAFLRGIHRVMTPIYREELRRAIESRCRAYEPDVLMVYKGSGVGAGVVDWARARNILAVNVFPDCSPHAHGQQLKEAIGRYDLVVSTKPFHPSGWSLVYGYDNECVFVPHGYDPSVHYWAEPPASQDLDVVVAASWRPQYEMLVTELASALRSTNITVGLAGPGWLERRSSLPRDWQLSGALYGRAYGEFVRRGRIVVAPVHRDVVIHGVRQPGDEDTTRTYELASAGCFFLHRRTPYVQTVYDEESEVPMWDDTQELASLIKRYLPDERRRREMAVRAHMRAVPTYSIPGRAAEVLSYVRGSLSNQGGSTR